MLQRLREKFSEWDKATVAVTFLLSLPILLLVIAIFAQYALLVNAKITVNRALDAACRSAQTAMPTDPQVDFIDGVAYMNKSARMTLESLSPAATASTSSESEEVAQALATLGSNPPSSYAARYTFAENATTIVWQRVDDVGQPIDVSTWLPADFAKHAGQRLKVTITYNFLLTVPMMTLPGLPALIGHRDTIAGINGYFAPISSSEIVQLSPGREAETNNNGWPQ